MRNHHVSPLLLPLLLVARTTTTTAQTYRRWSDIFPNGGPVIGDLPGGGGGSDPPPQQQVQYGLQPSCNINDPDNYNVCLDLVSVTNEFQTWMTIFDEAIQKWQQVITGDLPGQSSADLPTDSQFMCTEYPTSIDDIYLCGRDANIDGVGRVLGGAAPLFGQELENRINPKTNSPYLLALSGIMEFDIADINREIQDGRFLEIVKHEIGHVIGVGSELWPLNGLYEEGDPTYASNTNAEREWHDIIGCTNFGLPVELDGGQGTAGSHWDEQCLQDEIMTGFISGVQQPFSRITVGTLEDMGYVVDYDQADPFFRSQLGSSCANLCGRRRGLGSTLANESSSTLKRPQRRLTPDEENEVLLFAKSRLDLMRLNYVSTTDGIIYIGGKTMDVFYVDDNNDLHVIGVSEEQVRHL